MKEPRPELPWWQRGILVAVCALVIATYSWLTLPGPWEVVTHDASDAYYNLLVQGFRAGRLSLKKAAPPGLARLSDPYDPKANVVYQAPPYRLHDLSYYKGRLYLYFGVTPALILFWPFVAVTGRYLFQSQAVTIFCALGFLASVGLLCALWRRYFAKMNVGIVAACALALGLATGVPVMLAGSDVYEVAISCGYLLTMLALGAIWCALHQPEKRSRWLAMASLLDGLAVGARPTLLLSAVILLAPVAQAWRERRQIWLPLAAATGPILLIGLGLMLYNALRFGSPFEFGWHYQLSAIREIDWQPFSPRFLWFNFQTMFLAPARWGCRFPFVQEISMPPRPAGYGTIGGQFGVLSNTPVVWLALAAPLAWRSLVGSAASGLRWFVIAVSLLFGINALTLCLFSGANVRYEVEFLPALVLLAVVGIFGLQRTLSDRPRTRLGLAARWAWGFLLGFSVAFNLLSSIQHRAQGQHVLGYNLAMSGRMQEAIAHFEQALRINPDHVDARYGLGKALLQTGRVHEAIEQYQQALRLMPESAVLRCSLGNALSQAGQVTGAMQQYDQAIRIQPACAEAHYGLGMLYYRTNRLNDAEREYRAALRCNNRMPEAYFDLGLVYEAQGKRAPAAAAYRDALRINPDYAYAHNNLANLLAEDGKLAEAIQHYRQALDADPKLGTARDNLKILLRCTRDSENNVP